MWDQIVFYESDIIFKIDGEQMERGSGLRYGYLDKLNSTDLIIWIQMESEETKNFSIENSELPEQWFTMERVETNIHILNQYR